MKSKNDSNNEASRKMEVWQKCEICGRSKARMKNFGAIACRSCGAFFRRVITMNKTFDCVCPDNKNVSGCKSCRLKRCYEVGMKRELVQAIILRDFHEQRRNQLMGKDFVQPSLTLGNGTLNTVILESMIKMCDKVNQIWHSSMPLPVQFWDCSLEECLQSQFNILAPQEEFSHYPKRKLTRWTILENVQKYGLVEHWRSGFGDFNENERVNHYLRDSLIYIGIGLTLPAIKMLKLEDQVIQIRNTVPMAMHFLLAFQSLEMSTEMMVLPNGVGPFEIYSIAKDFYGVDLIEQMARKVFVCPMGMHARLKLDKCEFMLLMKMLLCTPTANSEISKEAQQMLIDESENYGKMLLLYQQHHFGEQTGALRYMESLRLIWSSIKCARKYQELLEYIDTVVHQGVLRIKTKIVNSLLYGL